MSESEHTLQIQQAITLIKVGQLAQAREILTAVVEADPQNETAWLWLATAAATREERIGHLERVLAINPDNETARKAHDQITGHVRWVEDSSSALPNDKMSNRMRYFYLISIIGVLAVITAVVVISLRNESQSQDTKPTVTIRSILPTATETPTSPYSPTPSVTPWPSATSGPSPTPPTLPPTWTPSPSPTTQLTATPRATWTPRPSATPIPTLEPPTATPTTALPTSTSVPTEEPTLRPRQQTATAAVIQMLPPSTTPSEDD